MDDRDRQAIEELFGKIARVEAQAGPRDRQSEAYLQALIARQPGAPYYMAQTIIVQEQALNEAQRRIEELERQPEGRASGGGFLDSLFGGSRPVGRSPAPTRHGGAAGPWSGRGVGMGAGGMGGGGFLAGAAQTAMGVAGGVVLGNMIADMLTPDQAAAAGIEPSSAASDSGDVSGDQVADADTGGGDFDAGGDFDMGDF